MSTGKIVLGTLAGLAIGGIAGILFAPQKGSTTRKQIMDKGDDYVNELKSKFDDFSDSIKEKFESTKKDAENLVEKGKAKYDDAKKDVKNAAVNFSKWKNYIQLPLSKTGNSQNKNRQMTGRGFWIRVKAIAKKCEAVEGIIKEAGELIESCEAGAMSDAGTISPGPKVEHYEIASYGTLHQFGETLGSTKVVSVHEATLNEEKAADEELTEIAFSAVNVEAREEVKEEFETKSGR